MRQLVPQARASVPYGRLPEVRRQSRTYLTVLAPAVLTVALGLWGIRRRGSLWQDEAVTYDMAHRTLPDLWATLGVADAVHGGYYLLMHGVFRLWDGGLVALRLPSVLAMACAAAGVAALGRRLAGPRAGLAAGVVFALLPAVQRYAQEGRSYALVTALVVAETWVLLRACAARRRLWWAGYAGLAVLSGLLHEFALPALAAHGVALLAARRPGAILAAWATAACLAVATVTPLVLLSLRQSRQVAWIDVSLGGDVLGFALIGAVGAACAAVSRRTKGSRALGRVAKVPPPEGVPPAGRRLARPLAAPGESPRTTSTRASARHAESTLPHARTTSRGGTPMTTPGPPSGRTTGLSQHALVTLALPLLLLPPASLLLASAVKPLYVDRYVLYAQAGLALLVGAALDTLWRSVRARGVVALVSAVAVLVAVGPVGTRLRAPQSRTDDVVAVSRAVRETAMPGDGVLFVPASRRVWAFGHEPASYGAFDLALAESRQRSHTLYGTELPAAALPDRILLVPRVVVVRDPTRVRHEAHARETAKEVTLRDHFTRCAGRAVGSARIDVYERGDHC
ncbi:glycosyltransferase family 39 protein [Streptomyces muensis]|uniref:Glycosyltransferase family 39 protein n=1 Tax=Streptomyces muensis TaxID=1077944 RepID=A0A9X1Q067_STRM4|nr:glycosyltransferase family 39 protein [Streptomyces muensis]MCF1595469.1 glycosyltransferase family 39 protein [Streptomyces muensis]